MQFLTNLFGGEGLTLASMMLALGIVLVLILLVLWGLKMMFRGSSAIGRGRVRRLTLVDAMPVDTRRQVLIIRRDNVEHLIMTGGPQDLVIETGIPVEAGPVRVPVRRSTAPNVPKLPQPKVATTAVTPAVRIPPSSGGATTGSGDSRPGDAERSREDPRPASDRQSPSLRHTGLLRAVSRLEPGVVTRFPENSPSLPPDSAKEGWTEISGKGHDGETSIGSGRGSGRSADNG